MDFNGHVNYLEVGQARPQAESFRQWYIAFVNEPSKEAQNKPKDIMWEKWYHLYPSPSRSEIIILCSFHALFWGESPILHPLVWSKATAP